MDRDGRIAAAARAFVARLREGTWNAGYGEGPAERLRSEYGDCLICDVYHFVGHADDCPLVGLVKAIEEGDS